MYAEQFFEPKNVEVLEARQMPGNFFICADDADQRRYFWSFRRLRLVGFSEGFIGEEGLITDCDFAYETARKLSGSPSGKLH